MRSFPNRSHVVAETQVEEDNAPPVVEYLPAGHNGGPRAARTILLFQIMSARPSKQPPMVRTFLKVYGARLLFLSFLTNSLSLISPRFSPSL